MLAEFRNKQVLLLQGPLGPFFKRFANELASHGAHVTKVNFNGGDTLFFPGKQTITYKGNLEEWPEYVSSLIERLSIDVVFLLGDMRPYHRCMREVTKKAGIALYIFEEGYLRPHFITLETGGVNGNSAMPKDSEYYLAWASKQETEASILPVRGAFGRSAVYAIMYMTAMTLAKPRYRGYKHHRDTNILYHGLCWSLGSMRKLKYSISESHVLKKLTSRFSGGYFLFPLQVHNDYQFEHSPYASVEACITEVVASFAETAPKEKLLVIKHHPADRPYRNYSKFIGDLTAQLGVKDRVFYVHDLHLPTLLKHALGTVLMNSTVGLSSLHHGTPVKVMGEAVYDFDGLTFGGTLNDFWHNPGWVDNRVYRAFRSWLLANNQANGSFYRRLVRLKKGTGVRWFERNKRTSA
ncbi:MAG: capsular biosynthesis protein [Myxococcota bacterium]|nr:capsular biosynthesis protein [Myxococcota bacterium]